MKQDDRVPFDIALHRARRSAFLPGEFVGQESFMGASEIRALAVAARIGPGVTVLDLCCGVAGPGRYITGQMGCTYLGVDYSASAIAFARQRAGGLGCRFAVARIPPLPEGSFDVVLLLETMLAFPDEHSLLEEIASVLAPGGRFAFTLEEGSPLTEVERALMPDPETVHLRRLADLIGTLAHVGLQVRWCQEVTEPHRRTVDSLIGAFVADAPAIQSGVGPTAFTELLAAHGLWSDWLRHGRVRKFCVVAEKVDAL